MIIPGSTAVLYPKMEQISVSLVDNIIFTLSKTGKEITLQKRYKSDGTGEVKYINERFCIPLTQEDTMLFADLNFLFIQGQINFISDVDSKPVGKTLIERRAIGPTLATELVEGNAPSLEQVDYFEMTIADAIFIDASMETIAANVTASEAAKTGAETARDESVAAKDTAVEKADAAALSETNAKTSEDNAKVSETNAKTSETVTAQAMTDYLAMLGVDVATLVGGKVPMSQIPATATQEIYTVASVDELTALVAQRGDLAELIETVDDEQTITKTWQLLGDGDPTVSANWVVWGTSYAVQAGNSTTATNAKIQQG